MILILFILFTMSLCWYDFRLHYTGMISDGEKEPAGHGSYLPINIFNRISNAEQNKLDQCHIVNTSGT